MEVYVKKMVDGKEVLDDAGKPVMEAVDINTLDIHDHPEAKKLKDEAIKYRKRLAEAKKAASEEESAASGDETPAKPNAQPETPAETPHIPTVEEIAEAVERRQAERQKAQTKAQQEWDAQVDAAMAKHKLPDAARNVVAQARDPEGMAEALAKAPLQFANTPSGGKTEADEINDMWKRIDGNLFGDKPKP